jgi:hypothetical protein
MAGIIGNPRRIVRDGLVLDLEASNRYSYPGTGNTWIDLSGNGNSATLFNAPTFSTANGGVLEFNGSSTYIKTPSISNFRTISMWIKTSKTGTYSWKYILDARPGMGNGWYAIVNGGSSIGNGWVVQYINGASTSVSSLNVPLNTWCNLVIISNAAYTSTINFMGRYSTGPTTLEYIDGLVGGIMIYNKALSAAEVLQNYNATKGRFGL